MIVDYERKAENSKKRVLDNDMISKKNKDNMLKYLNAIDVSSARIDIICNHLRILFLECDDLVKEMNNRDLVNSIFKRLKANWSDSYQETLKNVGKAFIRWHNDSETPKGWKDIKRKGKGSQKRDLSPKDMITWEEGISMIDNTNSIQIKAILMTQLDAGFRPSEFIDLNYDDISKEGKYYVAKVNGKTGKRDVILFKCIPYLERWLKQHPLKDKSPLWIIESPNNSRLNESRYRYPAIVKRIRKLGEKANINKPLDFYNLRHSSAVIKKLDNIPVDVASMNMGHSVKHFTETYGRLSIKDITKRYDKAYGLAKKDADQENPIECQYCHTSNEPKTEYCSQCGNPLSMNVALKEVSKAKEMESRVKQSEKTNSLIQQLINDPNRLNKLTEALSMIGKM